MKFIAALCLFLGLCGSAFAADPPTEAETQKIEAVVRAYLLKNPAIIREAIVLLQRQDAEQAALKVKATMAAARAELEHSPTSPVVGNPAAKATVVEFFDFRCGYCKRVAPAVEELLKTDPDVRVVYKQLPILGPESMLAAQAALAAHLQGKYKAFHDGLFALEVVNEESIMALAKSQGLDLVRLRADMSGPAVNAEIEANVKLSTPLGITGTPGFVIGDSIAPGALDLASMRTLVASSRKAPQ